MAEQMAATVTFRVYPCPLPGCDWEMTGDLPGPEESNGALADVFGWGVFGAVAKAERLRRTEEKIRAHLQGHPVEEYAVALANASKRIAELEEAACA